MHMYSFKKTASYCSMIVLAVFFYVFIISSYAHANPFISRVKQADKIAEKNGFEKHFIKTDKFTLTSYQRITDRGKPLTIYIEGDGRAWITPKRLSKDPTPKNTLVLELAAMDTSSNVVYLARPCQYTDRSEEPFYDNAYWSSRRFSEEVISSMDQAIDELRSFCDAPGLHLIGYSGGAAVAALVASRRDDVASFRSVAGNLDPSVVNKYHGVSELDGSLDPMDIAPEISDIPQRHFIGEKDKVVPDFVVENFLRAMGEAPNAEVIRVKNASHRKGWKKRWKELLRTDFKI